MKKILYLLLVILSISCSKKDDEQPALALISEDSQFLSLFEYFKEYKIENIFADPSAVNISRLDPFIFFSGQLKNSQKFGFIGFDAITKEKLFDLITFEYTSITVDEPYVGKKQVEVSSIKVTKFAENSSKSKVVVVRANDAVSYIYFINDNEVTNIISSNISAPEIIIWGQNFLLVSEYLNNFTLYSPTGEILTEGVIEVSLDGILLKVSLAETYTLDIINEFEAIFIDSYYRNGIICFISKLNLKEDNDTWSKEIDLSKLDKPRIDSAKLVEKTDTHFTYELRYTEYSGNKGVIKFKINIATGEIEYL